MTQEQRLGLADSRGRQLSIDRRLREIGPASPVIRPGKIHPDIDKIAWTFPAYVPRYSVQYQDYLVERFR